MPQEQYNPILYDQDVATNASTSEVVIDPRCKAIRIFPDSGLATVAINETGNLPLIQLKEAITLDNSEGRIKKIFIYSAAASVTNVKQIYNPPGVRTRAGVDS